MCKIMEDMRIESLKEVALRMLAAEKPSDRREKIAPQPGRNPGSTVRTFREI